MWTCSFWTKRPRCYSMQSDHIPRMGQILDAHNSDNSQTIAPRVLPSVYGAWPKSVIEGQCIHESILLLGLM